MQITERITVNAPVARLWKILVTDFAHMGVWSSAIMHSEINPNLPTGEIGRVCHTAVGSVAETVTHWDEQTWSYAYRTDKPPFFIKNAVNSCRLHALGPEMTVIEMQAEVELLTVFDWMARPIVTNYLRSLVEVFAEEVKYYAETGKVHPRKLRAQTKSGRPQTSTAATP